MNEENKRLPENPEAEELFAKTYERSEAAKKAMQIKLPRKKRGDRLAERDGDGTRDYTMSRYYGYVKARKRHPKADRFLKGLLIYGILLAVLLAVAAVAGWRIVSVRSQHTADASVRTLLRTTDADGWRQFLRSHLADTYPAYAKPADLAYKVLSDRFEIGKVTYLSDGSGSYRLFSDGRHFADLTYGTEDVLRGGEAVLGPVSFDMSFFSEVTFPETRVWVPVGAELTVNGVCVTGEASLRTEDRPYPGVSPGELDGKVFSTLYTFDNLYFVPELSCTLGGAALELHADEERREFWFGYPEEQTHAITVTVPSGVAAYVGGTLLSADWAECEYRDGALGALDDGGTGTLPRLSVWTVRGLFAETTVEAAAAGIPVSLISAENGNYVFNIPAECKYEVTVLYPAGGVLTVNGKPLGTNAVTTAATAADFSGGKTVLGSFAAEELDAAAGAVPAFLKTVLQGYLAPPIVSLSLNGTEVAPVLESTNGYRMRFEYDLPVSGADALPAERASLAQTFFAAYAGYLFGGGSRSNPSGAAAFDEKYVSLTAMTLSGTVGQRSLMESYCEVNAAEPVYGLTLSGTRTDFCVAYTDRCYACRLSADATGFSDAAGTGTPDIRTVLTVDVLLVRYGETWYIWAYDAVTQG